MEINQLRRELRSAIADYMRFEGCGCCGNMEKQKEAEERIAKLLNVPKYNDLSGFNFPKYQSK